MSIRVKLFLMYLALMACAAAAAGLWLRLGAPGAGPLPSSSFAAALALVLAFVAGAWLFSAWSTRELMRPVRALIRHCEELSWSKSGQQLGIKTEAELAALVAAFNQLSVTLKRDAETLAEAQARLTSHQESLEAQVQRRMGDLSTLNAELLAENKQLRASCEALNRELRRDELTGLYNRKAALELLDELRAQAQRGGRGFSLVLLLLEPDGERRNLPPGALDEVLRRFGHSAERLLRDGDCLARFEAFQFLAILPGATEAKAEALALEMAAKLGVRDELVHAGEPLGLTRYFGVAEYRIGESILACLERTWLSLPRR